MTGKPGRLGTTLKSPASPVARSRFIGVAFALRFGKRIHLRRVEINEVNALVGKFLWVAQPTEIVAEKETVHWTEDLAGRRADGEKFINLCHRRL